jgi:beta-galactosidase
MNLFNPPYLGSAYYPEDWPLEQIDEDVALMQKAGMTVARMAEFAWSKLEPEEGKYDFSWLHIAVDKLGKAGIASIIGTPTCTPPAWLSCKHPEILIVNDTGVRAQHGARRNTCPNNTLYRDYCKKIVTKMAEEFGHDKYVIGWQIDNELYWNTNRGCCCDVCHKKFHEHLKKKFGTIENLNETWGTHLWSQTYQEFDQIPMPREGHWHHPSLLTEWALFQFESYSEFTDLQAEILHRLSKHPVGTDMMPFNGLSYYRTNRNLDVVQHNHYHGKGNLPESVFWFDWCRPIKPRPFWNTETMTCWNGSVANGWYNEKGFCKVNSWLPIALGGEMNLYWLWRAHWSGQELMHGSVVTSHGRPFHIFDEVREISDGFNKAADFINNTRPEKSGIGIHFSHFAWHFFTYQPLEQGFNYWKLYTDVYRPMNELHFRPDVIDPESPLDDYKLIVSFFLPALDEGGLRERIKKWIEDGGTWVVGPFTDIRTIHSTKFKHAPFGSLEEWGGIHCKYEVPGNREFSIKFPDAEETKGSLCYSGFETRGAETLASYTEYPFEGLAAITRKRMGKGQIIILGTLLKDEDWKKFIKGICLEIGIEPVAEASPNVLAIPRVGSYGEGLVVFEIECKPGFIKLAKPGIDILSGKHYEGFIELAPYQVLLLK